MEKKCGIFVVKRLHFSNILDYIWTWTLHLKNIWTLAGLGLSFIKSGLDLDCKIWQSAHLQCPNVTVLIWGRVQAIKHSYIPCGLGHGWTLILTMGFSCSTPDAGAEPEGGDWGNQPSKTYESNFIHHDFVQFRKQHSRLRLFCRPLFCHSSVVKYTSSLLQ